MFYVGQKVVCVCDDPPSDPRNAPGGYWTPHWPKLGSVYTVRTIDICDDGIKYIRLHEVINPIRPFSDGVIEAGFVIRRFRPLTDITALEQIARDITEGKPVHIKECA